MSIYLYRVIADLNQFCDEINRINNRTGYLGRPCVLNTYSISLCCGKPVERPVLYLFNTPTLTEQRYWATELEMVPLVNIAHHSAMYIVVQGVVPLYYGYIFN